MYARCEMKIREGFVSNSSSASFILLKKYLTEEQIKTILKYDMKEITHKDDYSECWSIKDEEDVIRGNTSMDNDILHGIIYEMNPPLKAVLEWRCDG